MRALRRTAAAQPALSRRSRSQRRGRSSELTPSGPARPPRGGSASRSSFRPFAGLRSGSARVLAGAFVLLALGALAAPQAEAQIVSISAGTSPVTEGTAATFTISLRDQELTDTVVTFTVAEAAGSDFVAAANEGTKTVTVPARARSATYSVDTVDDRNDESNGSVTVTLSFTGIDGISGPTSATVTVNDNDGVRLTLSPSSVDEGGGQQTFTATVTLEGGTFATAKNYRVAGIAALSESTASADDFLGTDIIKFVTIPANTASASTTMYVTPSDDTVHEGAETLRFEVTDVGGATLATADLTITDNDEPLPVVSIAAGTSSVTEGTAASFTVSRNKPAPQGGAQIFLRVSEAAGSDFVASANEGDKSVTIPAGQRSATLSVPTVDDENEEPDGSVTVSIPAAGGLFEIQSPGSATVRVRDNDGTEPDRNPQGGLYVPTVRATDLARVPRNAALSPSGVVTWDLDTETEQDPIMPYMVQWIAATRPVGSMKWDWGDDHIADGGFGSIEEHECYSGWRCRVQIPDFDPQWHYLVHVNTAHRMRYKDLRPAVLRHTPTPPPGAPRVSVSGGPAVTEGTAVTFTVRAEPAPASDLAVYVSVSDAPGANFVTREWEGLYTVTVPAGRASAAMQVRTRDDRKAEPGGNVTAALVAGVDYALGDAASATVTVRDNDGGAPPVSKEPDVTVADARADEADGAALEFTVTLDRAGAETATVDYASADGTATAGEDYTAASGTLTFAPGETEKTVSVAVLDDAHEEGEETLTLRLSNPSGLRVAGGEATGTIASSDAPPPEAPPPAPEPVVLTGLTVSPASDGDNALDVSWNNVRDSRGYAIQWKADGQEYTFPERSWSIAGTSERTQTYRIEGLMPNRTYTVKVTARPPDGSFGASAEATGTTGPASGEPEEQQPVEGVGPEALTGLSVSSVAGEPTQLAVAWDAVQGAATYGVRWKTGAGDYGDAVETTTNRHTVTGLTPGTTYTVNVAAIDADNTLLAEGVASGATGEAGRAPAAPAAPRFVVYHDASDPAAVRRYEQGVQALGDAGVSHETRQSSSAEVSPLAGVTHSVMPRFFFGDPEQEGWGPPRQKVNNGGLRWLKAHLANLSGLSVADARVTEASDATLAFSVTLASAATHPVTVAYATADGTAKAGEDYTATSGTLAFAAGETAKTVSVAVLDDVHDEGEETLTLTLSNASGARIADGTATGTIANTDPLQQEWLARFGRTVAGQMIEALEGRFAMDPDTPSHLTIAGRRVDFSDAPPMPDPERWRDEEWMGEETRDMAMRELLLGSSFHFTTGAVSGPGAMTAWGKALSGGASTSQAGGLSLASETVTGVLGMDWERDKVLVGVALSESVETGSAGFAPSGGEYDLEGALSLVTPYARIRASDRLSVWTMMGSGEGSLSLAHGDASQSADIALQVVAAGGRAELLRPEGDSGFSLALKTDAYLVRTESAGVSAPGVGNLAGATGDASRVRAVLEGSRTFSLSGGGSVEPSLSLGLRHDGGDAETGTGVELGAGLSWSDPSHGLTSNLRLYGLAAHEAGGHDEWGVSGSLRIAPPPSGRGLSLSMTPSWGAEGQSGRLWDTRPSALAGDGGEPPTARLDTELGYGLSLSGGLTGTPYVGLGLGDARDYRLGWRLASGRWQSFSLGVEAARSEAANDDAPEHRIGLDARFRW